MSGVNTYLNFHRNTEEAIRFYRSVLGGEFAGAINRCRDKFGVQWMFNCTQKK
jgi:uncharacterized glyoxalase superfamily protein PhnB